MASYFPQHGYPVPPDEQNRLRVARKLEFLADPTFESHQRASLTHLCELARELLGVERAYVSLVFADEQRMIAKTNLAESRAPRSLAFCAHTVAQNKPLVVRDATADPRFSANPFVTGPFQLRFYAGVPLEHEGQPVGTFCVVSSEPRELRADELARLGKISAVAHDQIQMLSEHHALRQQAALLRQSERFAQMGGWTIDRARDEILWSSELYRLHEVDPSTPLTFGDLDRFYPHGGGDRLIAAVDRAVANGRGFELELDFVTAGGAIRTARIAGQVEPRIGLPPRVLGVFRDLTEQRELEAKWEEASLHDAVTGLPNEARLRARLTELGAEGSGGAVMLVGLDDMQRFRDSHGAGRSDAVLRSLGIRVITETTGADLVARVGDDQIAVLFRRAEDGDSVFHQEQALHALLASFFDEAELSPSLTASMGVVVFPDDADNPNEILRAAGIALSAARLPGSRRTEYFARALRDRVDARAARLADLRGALAADELSVLYQPICDLAGQARGFEAVLVWCRPGAPPGHGPVIAPASVDLPLSTSLCALMLERGLKQVSAWRREGVAVGYIAVGLPSAELVREGLSAEIREALARHGVDPRRLLLEIDEAAFLSGDHHRVGQNLGDLRAIGVRFALSRFGTGAASLANLRALPVDRVKIDRGFVHSAPKDERDAAIVGAIVSLGRALGVEIVAEGVESATQLALLERLGCALVQGDYVACPLLPGEAAAFCGARGEASGSVEPPVEPAPRTER